MKKLFTVSLLVILLIILSSSLLFAKETLVVHGLGGTFEQSQREIMLEPFQTDNDCTVVFETSLSLQTANKMRAQKDNPVLATPSMDEIYAVQPLVEGLFATLDYSKLPNAKDVGEKFRADHNKYISWFFSTDLIAYNSEYVEDPPKVWKDLWDPKYAGKLILPDITTSHGIALLATLAILNGGSEDNIEPGFEALKSLKPNVLTYWTNHDQVARMLNLGEAWVAVWCDDRAYTQEAMGSPIRSVIPEDGTWYFRSVVGIPVNYKNKDLAYKWIDQMLSPKVQKYISEHTFVCPVNSKVTLDISPELQEKMMGESTVSKLIALDYVKINKYKEEWTERFRREITSG